MQTILVTGARGFVGSHLIRELMHHDMRVVAVDREIDESLPAAPLITRQAVDLRDQKAVAEIDFGTVDGVVHLAGLAAVGPSFDDPLAYITTNMGIEINLFEEALRQKANARFLVISSGSLYGPNDTLPLTETSALAPSSPYAVSKLGQEQLAQYYSLRGFECVVARPFNHIGPGQRAGFIVPDLTKQAVDVAAGRASKVMVGDLDAKRDYTDVRDIVRAYRLLLEHGKPNEIYNICSGKATSGHELLQLITKAAGANPTTEQDSSLLRPTSNPEIYGDHSKLTADTGWKPQISLETTIQDCVTDWRNRLKGAIGAI